MAAVAAAVCCFCCCCCRCLSGPGTYLLSHSRAWHAAKLPSRTPPFALPGSEAGKMRCRARQLESGRVCRRGWCGKVERIAREDEDRKAMVKRSDRTSLASLKQLTLRNPCFGQHTSVLSFSLTGGSQDDKGEWTARENGIWVGRGRQNGEGVGAPLPRRQKLILFLIPTFQFRFWKVCKPGKPHDTSGSPPKIEHAIGDRSVHLEVH